MADVSNEPGATPNPVTGILNNPNPTSSPTSCQNTPLTDVRVAGPGRVRFPEKVPATPFAFPDHGTLLNGARETKPKPQRKPNNSGSACVGSVEGATK
jgi:hypothetical protein